MAAQSTRRSDISRIIKTLLAFQGENQRSLAGVLDVDPSQITRKMKTGKWSIDDLDTLAEHFNRPITVFFVDPDTLFGGSDLGSSLSRWITGYADQLSLFTEPATTERRELVAA